MSACVSVCVYIHKTNKWLTDEKYSNSTSTQHIHIHSKYYTEFAFQVYKALNTRVALVAVETWNNGDKSTITSSPDTTLDNFNEYKKNTLRSVYNHDIAELLTYDPSVLVKNPNEKIVLYVCRNIDFQGSTVGLAPVKGICTAGRSSGINQVGYVCSGYCGG